MTRLFHSYTYKGKRYDFIYDEHYQVDRQCAPLAFGNREPICTCPEADKADCEKYYQEELSKLDSGEWVALGCLVYDPCPGVEPTRDMVDLHCPCCSGWTSSEVDSLWGIVIDNDPSEAEKFVREEMA